MWEIERNITLYIKVGIAFTRLYRLCKVRRVVPHSSPHVGYYGIYVVVSFCSFHFTLTTLVRSLIRPYVLITLSLRFTSFYLRTFNRLRLYGSWTLMGAKPPIPPFIASLQKYVKKRAYARKSTHARIFLSIFSNI